jgi:hypothetical protein
MEIDMYTATQLLRMDREEHIKVIEELITSRSKVVSLATKRALDLAAAKHENYKLQTELFNLNSNYGLVAVDRNELAAKLTQAESDLEESQRLTSMAKHEESRLWLENKDLHAQLKAAPLPPWHHQDAHHQEPVGSDTVLLAADSTEEDDDPALAIAHALHGPTPEIGGK